MRNRIIEAVKKAQKENLYKGYRRSIGGAFTEDELELFIENDIDQIMHKVSSTIYDLVEDEQELLILKEFGL